MSAVFKTLGKISGVISTVAAFIPGGQLLSVAFAANAAIMGALGGLTAKKPPVLGSVSQITIGANQLTPQIIGRCYYGGSRVAQEAYGTEDKVPNAHAIFVDVASCGGPIEGLVQAYTDFNTISFTGTNADGYYHNNLHLAYQLGETPESAALEEHWAGAPNWGTAHKLSGLAAGIWSARWPKDGKVFASGFPQTGAVWDGVKTYDPRLDSTYPGGSGSQRWADPQTAASSFATAKATWTYSRCPGLNALRYALGTWERGSGSDPFVQVFGMGLSLDAIAVADFVELANVCDANGWQANGVIFEPGSTWDNLKRILAAGGAEPVWKGALLGLKINAPKVSLDTITWDDIAGEVSASAMQSYRDRPNTLIPMYRDAGQKWELAAADPIQVTSYVTADGGERQEQAVWEMVTDKDQAAQLTGYMLVNGREMTVELPLKTRCRRFLPGEQYTLASDLASALNLASANVIVVRRSIDPGTMGVTLTVMTETAGKHSYALGLTGSGPPALDILTPDVIDGAVNAQPGTISFQIVNAYITGTAPLLTAYDTLGFGPQIAVADHNWVYPNSVAPVARAGNAFFVSFSTTYYVYFDDETLADGSPTYHATTDKLEAVNGPDHPERHYLGTITTPGSGGPPSSGGGDGGGGVGGGGGNILA